MHSHANDQHHHHHRPTRDARGSLRAALAITGAFLIAEFAGALYTNSLALLADSGHMLTDVAAIGLSLFAYWFASRPATLTRTYGFYRVEILAALVNGVVLVLIAIFIFYEAYQRLLEPAPVKAGWMLVVAIAGLLANLAAAHLLFSKQSESLNVRGAFMHVLGDAVGSLGAIAASLAILFWDWRAADPVISAFVAVLILYSSWILIRDAVDVLLESAPSHINMLSLKEHLGNVGGVESVHDLHVWALTSGMLAMSCHVVVDCERFNSHDVLEALNALVRERFRIGHTTIQIEEENLQHDEVHSCN